MSVSVCCLSNWLHSLCRRFFLLSLPLRTKAQVNSCGLTLMKSAIPADDKNAYYYLAGHFLICIYFTTFINRYNCKPIAHCPNR